MIFRSIAIFLIGVATVLGVTIRLSAKEPDGKLLFTVVDAATGKPLPCRMHLADAQGEPVKLPRHPFWHDHFVFPGTLKLKLPAGKYTFTVEHGPEYSNAQGEFELFPLADDIKQVLLTRQAHLKEEGWWSADLHVHRPIKDMPLIMQAEDLHVAPVITWWNDKNPWNAENIPSELLRTVDGDRFFQVMAGEDERGGGALLFFNRSEPLAITDAQREYPASGLYMEQAKEDANTWVEAEKPFWWDLPMWVALGQVDSIGIANNHLQRGGMLANEAWGKPRDTQRLPDPFGNALWTQEIYFHLLNCGLRIPPSAGSASGVLPNPVGYNRVYAYVGSAFSYAAWWEGLRAGKVFVSNGPLLRAAVGGKLPGHLFQVPAGQRQELEPIVTLSSRDPVSQWEVIQNGEVVQTVNIENYLAGGKIKRISMDEPGWFLFRVQADVAHTYRFAMTGPFYVEVAGQPPHISRKSAQFFVDWEKERMSQLEQAIPDEIDRALVLTYHERSLEFWEDVLNRATVD